MNAHLDDEGLAYGLAKSGLDSLGEYAVKVLLGEANIVAGVSR